MRKKGFWLPTFGPIVVGAVIVFAVLFGPWNRPPKLSASEEKKLSVAQTANVMKSDGLKSEVFSNTNYVPFFGSSELSRIDPFHPSVLADYYHREYMPFMLGAPGTQSLTHYFNLRSMEKEIRGKKAVVIISPQWFTKEGISEFGLVNFTSSNMIYTWLNNATTGETDRYLAGRLMNFDSVKGDTFLKSYLEKITSGKGLNVLDRQLIQANHAVLKKEDAFFEGGHSVNKWNRVKRAEKALPENYNAEVLDQLAYEEGERQSTNNPFRIKNRFYTKRIKPEKGKLAGSQKDFNYLKSPEYADFELLLSEFQKLDMQVLFVIQPVNFKWAEYTELSRPMLEDFAKKISYQLTSQGFENVVDFTEQGDVPYFMKDTIHLGWRGWVAFDKHVVDFMQIKDNQTNYKLNEKEFLSKKWQGI
ncbi:MAG: D-alanyl-lipoteichoic acid biosynthesis protein DltD [Lactobacillales bacterium]|jgi:D-alanine transfer protein|nr:D-alanyl-lipoteichoic acid biosynthesis protein DltD [Lactobacillales bacterium]